MINWIVLYIYVHLHFVYLIRELFKKVLYRYHILDSVANRVESTYVGRFAVNHQLKCLLKANYKRIMGVALTTVTYVRFSDTINGVLPSEVRGGLTLPQILSFQELTQKVTLCVYTNENRYKHLPFVNSLFFLCNLIYTYHIETTQKNSKNFYFQYKNSLYLFQDISLHFTALKYAIVSMSFVYHCTNDVDDAFSPFVRLLTQNEISDDTKFSYTVTCFWCRFLCRV